MKEPRVTHVGFSDESNWNTGRFRSLGLVTAPLDHLEDLERKARASSVAELKWSRLTGARERSAALSMCDLAVQAACEGKLRVDVLVWDIQDERHDVRGRDDVANLQRMYYHLFRNVLRARWPDDAVWRLHPDEHTAMNWQAVEDCLQSVAQQYAVDRSLFTGGKFRVRLRREFGIEEIRPVSSGRHPLLQLADLFAGMAVFSRNKFPQYRTWLSEREREGQSDLFADDGRQVEASRSMRARFEVLRHFDSLCKKHKLGVSLKSRQGLWTPKPENPLNFWLYEAQHPLDKAPRRANA